MLAHEKPGELKIQHFHYFHSGVSAVIAELSEKLKIYLKD
jgi:hypothetical protein